jgi:hypothetical protein
MRHQDDRMSQSSPTPFSEEDRIQRWRQRHIPYFLALSPSDVYLCVSTMASPMLVMDYRSGDDGEEDRGDMYSILRAEEARLRAELEAARLKGKEETVGPGLSSNLSHVVPTCDYIRVSSLLRSGMA